MTADVSADQLAADMTAWLDDGDVRLYHGDALETLRGLPDGSVDCVVTSPPYWGLRDYGTGEWAGGDPDCDHKMPGANKVFGNPAFNENRPSREQTQTAGYRDVCGKCGATRQDRQLGLEATPDQYVHNMVQVFREVRRVLADHGTCWVNLGTSYASGQTPQPRRAPAYGNGDKAPQDSPATGSACPDLCDECRDATQIHRDRNADSTPPPELDAPLSETTGRDSGPPGSGIATSDGEPHDAQASTNPQSSAPPPGGCSHCANCGACLAVLRSSTRDARLCVRTEPSTNGTPSTSLSSADRTSDTEPSALAYLYSTIAARRLKPKDDVLIPQILGLALQLDGWYVRSEIIWGKLNPMPESVTDRPTKSHETIWLLTKSPRYWFDTEAVREPASENTHSRGKGIGVKNAGTEFGQGIKHNEDFAKAINGHVTARNVRSVWQIATQPYPEAHFATFPEELARRCILAGCPVRVCGVCGKPSERIVERDVSNRVDGGRGLNGDRADGGKACNADRSFTTLGWSDCGHNNWRPGTVLDPFIGSGTTAKVARDHQRHAIGIDLSSDYLELAARRLQQLSLLNEVEA